jgi:hypothetical protein
MTSRLLPREEWHKAAHAPIAEAFATLPEGAVLLVVEDAGAIVGTWAVMPYIHVHGLWIAPAYRGRSTVMRRLLQGLERLVGRGTPVLTSAEDPDIEAMVRNYGGRQLPGVPMVFSVGGRSCQQSSRS